ncbi:MAG TPA: PIN domain-containing protein [Verrucomicrobiota bacterium]|nr:PIN domain-containing protein [Verrucomicrobiota bacterium]HNU49568.1 PIN domain-containing protein [Verrucomicrobiota bacterium]
MAADPVLVDSSFYIRTMREGRDPLKLLAFTAATRDLAVCGVVRCEVARGLHHRTVLDRYQAIWNVMIWIPTDDRLWQSAERLLWQLDRRGVILPLPDVVVACCALRAGATLLAVDRHFSHIPGLRLIDRLEA